MNGEMNGDIQSWEMNGDIQSWEREMNGDIQSWEMNGVIQSCVIEVCLHGLWVRFVVKLVDSYEAERAA